MRALVRPPGPRLVDGLVMHGGPAGVDPIVAIRQWEGYVDVLRGLGWTTTEVAPADECPDAVFVEDALVVYKDLAVIARPGAISRRPETPAAAHAARQLGLRVVEIRPPGTLDGGDVLKVGETVYCGVSARTNAEGARQLAGHLQPLGATVVPVPVVGALHLKSVVTALPDHTLIGPPADALPAAMADALPPVLAMPEDRGAHVVDLGKGRLLVDAQATRSIGVLRGLGYTPVPVEIGEFVKLDGCVTCLSVRVRH